jgi:ribose 5-phosphate isomerase B
MKTVKSKQILVGADTAGFDLKEAVCAHLRKKGWEITDMGALTADQNRDMFHRMAIRVASMVSEGEFDRALLFCGTGMGVHIAASKVPGIHSAVVESVPSALRAITGNGVNVMCMGGHYIAFQMGIEIAEAFLNNDLGTGYEWWPNFYEFHKLAIDEMNVFDYEEYKASGFKFKKLGDVELPYDCINTK